jgi:hypothetical protein
MTREQSYIYLLKQIRKMINLALEDIGEPPYDPLEPNYGKVEDHETSQNRDSSGQSTVNKSNNCKVCD